MGTHSQKAQENMYFRCRKAAAAYNDKLNSREGAAELLGVSASSLADYELGNTKVVPVDKVNLMADIYNAPELRNYYCRSVCPLGENRTPDLEVAELDRLTLRILSAFRNASSISDRLLDIAADGKISADEKPALNEVLDALDMISQHSQELRLWAEKNLGGSD